MSVDYYLIGRFDKLFIAGIAKQRIEVIAACRRDT